MTFYLNPFPQDFYGSLVLGDRQYSQDFKCPRNAGRGEVIVSSYGTAPFDLSGNDADGDSNDVLKISFAINDFRNWIDLNITITGASSSAITTSEVVSSLTANATFANYFTAVVGNTGNVLINQTKSVDVMKFYIQTGQADTVLNFNKFAGVAELPTYFDRHTVANRFNFTDSQNAIIALSPGTSSVEANYIDNAVDPKGNSLGFDHTSVSADWQLFQGKSGIFNFQKITVDGSDRITQIIEYSAGSVAGDLARKIQYTYSSTNTNPSQITEIPYVLQSGDLVIPS
jgi:hypothetical protein